jgi:hypothetical protein
MKEKFLFFVAITIVLLQIFVYFPISIWIQNQFNFSVQFLDGKIVFIYIFFIILITSLIVSLITPKIIRNYLFPLMVILSLLILIQQNILVWNYGILDGKNLNFEHVNYKSWIDFSLWFSGFILLILKRKYLIKNAGVFLSFSVIVSTSILLLTIYSFNFNPNKSSSYTEENKFSFSKDKNILVFVLDGFQSGVFWEMINQEPELKKEFEGFTYYPNTTSVFAKTYPSIPLMLTGKVYQKQQPITSFLDSAYEESLLSDMVDSGWDVGLYPYVKNTIKFTPSIMNNYLDKVSLIEKSAEYLQALDLTFFRSIPHFAKVKLFKNRKLVIHDDAVRYLENKEFFINSKIKNIRLPKPSKHVGLNFLHNIKTNLKTTSDKPVFRFYHLMMPHAPFVLNRNLEYGNYERSFESYKNYSYASIKLMSGYLQELKESGVYDNSKIIILADHGGGDYSTNNYNPKTSEFLSTAKNAKPKASGKPIFLLKDFNATEPMKISQKPVSLLDVAPTIAKSADVKFDNQGGFAIDELSEQQQRIRTYYYYKFTSWDSKYLQDFKIFEINGDVYDDNSWSEVGVLSAKNKQNIKVNDSYVFSKTIHFGTDLKVGSDYRNQFLIGKNFRYSHSSVQSKDLQFNIDIKLDEQLSNQHIYKIDLNLVSNISGTDIVVEADNNLLAEFKLNKRNKKYEMYYQPNDLLHSKQLKLKVYALNKKSKAKMSLSKLVIYNLKNLRLQKFNKYSIIKFSDDLQPFFAKGFSNKRAWGRWTNKETTSILFEAGDSFCQDSILKLTTKKFNNTGDTKPIITVNGNYLNLLSMAENKDNRQLFYDCSKLKLEQNKIIVLEFKMPKEDIKVASEGKKRKINKAALESLAIVEISEMLND